jgi:hypothetical protein
MIKYKINDKNLDKKSIISVDLSSSVNFENDEFSYQSFLEEQALNTVNPVFDNEIKWFSPLGFEKIIINIKENDIQLNYSDFNYNDTDIISLTNRFINSYLRVNFYTSNDPANQTLFYQVDLNNQINGNDNLTASDQKIVYEVYDPNKSMGKQVNSLAYKVPFFKNPNHFTFPFIFYADFQYLNAINGDVIRLISSSDAIDFNNLYDKLYIKYQLNKINDTFIYTIDDTDRNISMIANNKVINLNILNVL